MKPEKSSLFIFMTFVLLLAGIYACERMGSSKKPTSASDVTETERTVSALMEELNIQSVTEPIAPPDFTLKSITGEEVSLSQLHGNVVMLGFWTTW